MSKLQKKKPSIEKKKRKVGPETEATGSVVAASGPKPAAPIGAPKSKTDKGVDAGSGVGNVFNRAAEFVREVKVELKKVTWPTRKQTTGTTIVVILFVFVVAAFLGLFDYSLSKLVQVVLT